MPKFYISRGGAVLTDPMPYVAGQCEPVIIIPAAKWRELVELTVGTRAPTRIDSGANRLDAIIAEVEASNG